MNPGDSCGNCGTVQCDGTCNDPCNGCTLGSCSSDEECTSSEYCYAGCCWEGHGCSENEIDCNGTCQVPTCTFDSDCEYGNSCVNGGTCNAHCQAGCSPQCYGDYDCGGRGYSCVDPGTCDATCCAVECYGDWECSDPLVCYNAGTCSAYCSGGGYGMVPGFRIGSEVIRIETGSAGVGYLLLDLNGNGQFENPVQAIGSLIAVRGAFSGKMANRSPSAFQALAELDQKRLGGNRDGWLNARDPMYSKLRLWIDKNHNGVVDSGELSTLSEAGILGISVHYSPVPHAMGGGYRTAVQMRKVAGQYQSTHPKAWAYNLSLDTARPAEKSK